VPLPRSQGRILLVKPTCKDTWELPCGAAEEGEFTAGRMSEGNQRGDGFGLLRTAFWPLTTGSQFPTNEEVRFDSWGGVLDDSAVEAIQLDQTELSTFRFVSVGDLDSFVLPADGSTTAIGDRESRTRSALP